MRRKGSLRRALRFAECPSSEALRPRYEPCGNSSAQRGGGVKGVGTVRRIGNDSKIDGSRSLCARCGVKPNTLARSETHNSLPRDGGDVDLDVVVAVIGRDEAETAIVEEFPHDSGFAKVCFKVFITVVDVVAVAHD
jgi:hypothetical protein